MMPNGTSYTIESEEDTDLEQVKSYYEENQGENVKPTLVFPVKDFDITVAL